MEKIKIGILGYGNLGSRIVSQNPDMELVGVFTRRDPSQITLNTKGAVAYHIDQVSEMRDKIDVLILCGGSATDLPVQTPEFTRYFNTIDSFDTHANIPGHYATVDAIAKASNKVSIISVGWDPGVFFLNRMYAGAILPDGKDIVWGKGVSQGHSDAIRRIEGVQDAKQYTIPVPEA